ncbi:hypothetical protein [Bordetella trematum]|uniref:hypothetical protein n=1 Tax=Bordetella trematum TaxID=123899 RepID=UPI0039890A98
MEKPSKTDPTASLACFLHMLAQQCVAAFRSFFPVFLNHQSRKREQSEIRSHLNQKPCPCSASHYFRVTRQNNQVQQTSVNASPADTRTHPAGEAAKASSTERYDARARATKREHVAARRATACVGIKEKGHPHGGWPFFTAAEKPEAS